MNNFISGNNLNVSGDVVIAGDISQNVDKRAVLGELVSESIVCNGDIHADNLTIYNDFSIAGQLSTNSILTNNLDTQYIRLNGETVDLSSLTKLSNINGNVKDYVDSAVSTVKSDILGGASSAYDTLKEIQTVLESNTAISDTLTQLQNKVDKYETDGTIKQFAYTNKNNSFSGTQNFTGASVTGLTKIMVGLGQVNNTSDLEKPISNATFSELNKKVDKTTYDSAISTLTNSVNNKLDSTTYSTFLTTNTTNLGLKLDKDVHDTYVASNNTALTLKLDKSIYDTFLTTNTNNLLLKLDKSVYDSFVSTNTSNLNLKLDKSVYDAFVTSNTTNLNAKLNATDFFDVIDLKLDTTDFNTYQLSNNTAINTINTTLDNVKNTITGITYTNLNNADITSIDNNVEITKTLKINGIDYATENNANKARITSLETKTTGISYGGGADDITYIDNHVVMPGSNSLYLGDNYAFNVKSEIQKRSLLTGDNAFSGNNTFQSDSTPFKITTKNNPTLNNGLAMHFIFGNGTYNDLCKQDDIMLMTGNVIKDNAKSAVVIAPWATGAKGIRISMDKLQVAPGVIETNSHVIDASTSKLTIKPQGYNGGLEVYSTNGTDASLKTLRLSITDTGGVTTSGYTSLNNGNLVLLDSNTHSYKNIIMKNKVLLLANASDRAVQLYQNNETFSIDSSYMNSSRISMSVRGAGTYDTNNIPTGTVVNALIIDSGSTSINNNTTITGTLSTTSTASLCNGVLDVTATELTINKTVHYVGSSALFYDTTTKTGTSVTNIYRNPDKNLYIDSDYFKNSTGGGVIFRLRDKSEALGGTASNVMSIQPDSITMNKNLTVNGTINGVSSTTLSYLDATSSIQTQINTINSKVGAINYTPTVTISKTQSNSSFYGLVATLTTTGSFKRSVKFVSPISIYRKASANRPPDNSISSLQIRTIINSVSCEVKKNGVVQPAGTIGFTFSETLPKNLYAYKWATQTNATNNEYEYEMYAGNLTILHDINSSSASEVFTYHINVSITIVASNETVIMQYLNTNTNISTSYNTYPNVLSAVDSYYIPKYYASPSYEFSVSRSNLPTTDLLQINEIGANEIGANKLYATTANLHTIYNTGNFINSGYIKSRSNIAGYMFNGNLTTSSISPFSIYPIICSMKGIAPLNADDYYLVNPGYRMLLFDDLNYNGYDPQNDANNSLSNFTNFYKELINDSNEPKTFALTTVNRTESIIVYYRDNDTMPWTLIYMPYLSYVPS